MDKIKILIVEDDDAIISLYKATLSDTIFELNFSGNGDDGLETYKVWKPDVILLDIVLPVTSGYAVLQKIRTELGDTKTTIIMTTSLGKKEDIVDCMNFGIQGYLVKPFDHKNITANILAGYGKLQPERAAKAIEAYKGSLQTNKKDKGTASL